MISAAVAEGLLAARHYTIGISIQQGGLIRDPGRTGGAARVSARTYAKLLLIVAGSSLHSAAAASYGLPLQSIP
jgi:hypothetical protein